MKSIVLSLFVLLASSFGLAEEFEFGSGRNNCQNALVNAEDKAKRACERKGCKYKYIDAERCNRSPNYGYRRYDYTTKVYYECVHCDRVTIHLTLEELLALLDQ